MELQFNGGGDEQFRGFGVDGVEYEVFRGYGGGGEG